MSKYIKKFLPFIMIFIITFIGIMAGFILYNVKNAQKAGIDEHINDRINVLLVSTNERGYAQEVEIASLDPKTKSVNYINIPTSIYISVSSSLQPIRNAMAIGGIDVIKEKISGFLPIPIDYYAVFEGDEALKDTKSTIEYFDYNDKSVSSQRLKDIILSISTDLSSFETDKYIDFLGSIDFSLTKECTLPVSNKEVNKYDIKTINDFFDTIIQ